MDNPSGALPGDAEIRSGLRALLRSEGPRWLESRRWFADKGRGIDRVEFDDLLLQQVDRDFFTLVVVTVAFTEGLPERYFLPLAVVETAERAEVIATASFVSPGHLLVDGAQARQIGNWLLDLMDGRAAPASPAWQFDVQPAARHLLERARIAGGEQMRAEQSNTSIRFDDALIVKLLRRLQPAPNPDEEILRALGSSKFPRVPQFAGSASWLSPDGIAYPIALAQAFVPNQGDGWVWMLRRLRKLIESTSSGDFDVEQLLGRRTGELHIALSRIETSGFAPETSDPGSVTAEMQRFRGAVETAISLLAERESLLGGEVQSRLPSVIGELRAAARQANGFSAEIGLPRIRGHGDFHLGQALRTANDDWVFLDFEGEPARPIAERRQKASALKDVAGMLRSFAYARAVVEREVAAGESPGIADRLATWELEARQAFLSGYRQSVRTTGRPLVPREDDAFDRALAAWETDKALYEIAYEARNRPEWMEIPLDAIRVKVPDHPSDDAGAPAKP